MMIRLKPKLQYSQKIVSRFRKSVRFWASLICIVGAVFHTGIISLNYLMHPLGASLEMKTINNFVLPSVSICFEYFINDLMYIDHPVYPIKVATRTVKQINDDLIKWQDLIIFCKVLDINYNQVDCESLIVGPENMNNTNRRPVIEQLSHYLKCFTLFSGFSDTISYDRDKVGDSPLIEIRINTYNLSLDKRLGLYIMSPFDQLDESIGNPSLIQFDAIDSNQATVTFESIFIYQFKSEFYQNCFPYATNEGYQKFGCRSQQACVNQCIFEATYNKTGTTHYRRFIKTMDEYSDARFAVLNDSQFLRECIAKYPIHPCLFHRYKPLLTSQYASPYRKSEIFQISVLYPETVDVIVRYGLTQSLTEYLIFLLSTLCLWTELSLNKIINSFLLSVYSCYEKVCLKFTQTSNSLAVRLRSDTKTGVKPATKAAKSRTTLGTRFDVRPGAKSHAKLDAKLDSSTGVNLGIYKSVGGKVTRKKLLSSKGLNNSLLDYY